MSAPDRKAFSSFTVWAVLSEDVARKSTASPGCSSPSAFSSTKSPDGTP